MRPLQERNPLGLLISEVNKVEKMNEKLGGSRDCKFTTSRGWLSNTYRVIGEEKCLFVAG
jgi:hypothetical protein